LKARLESQLGDNDSFVTAVYEKIKPHIPQFIYFDVYSSLPYTVNIEEVLRAERVNENETPPSII